MIVNGEEIKGLIIKDSTGHIIGVIQDKGAYYFQGYTIEVLPDDTEVNVDPLNGTLEVKKETVKLEVINDQTMDSKVKIEKMDQDEEDDVIIEGVDFTS